MPSFRLPGSTLRLCLLGLSLLYLLPLWAHAQPSKTAGWPAQPLRVVVPFPAEGPTDVVARLIAQQAGTELGQPIIVDNKPGAGGTLGAAEVAHAAADGHTLLLTTASTHAVSPHLFKAFPYNATTDFTPIAHLGSAGSVLLVAAGLQVASVQELIALAQKSPGKLTYGSSGSGTIVHLVTEAFAARAGIRLTHIPYRGTGLARADLLAGSLDMLMDAIPTGMPYVQKGVVQALAVTTRDRSALAPQVPTLHEAGLRDIEFSTWFGLYAPAGLPEDRRVRLHDAFSRAVQSPGVTQRLQVLGVTPAQPHSPADFASLVEADSKRWKQVIDASKLGVQ